MRLVPWGTHIKRCHFSRLKKNAKCVCGLHSTRKKTVRETLGFSAFHTLKCLVFTMLRTVKRIDTSDLR